MITPSFALTATERALPRMALDFTTASLDSRVTFTRSGNTATVVNSSGFIAPINANLPRFDYDPTTLVCKGLLIEEARTNLLLYSNDLSQVSWTKSSASINTPAINSPDGTQNVNRITFTAAGGDQRVVQSAVTVISSVYTSSVYLKGTIGETVTLEFDTDALTVVLTSSFVRYSKTGTANTTSAVTRIISRTGNTATVVDCYGVQTELGAFATSLIPTVATSVTRNPDVATMTGTNFSSWFNASEGAIQVNASRYVQGVANGVLVGFAQSGVFGNSTYVSNDSGAAANLTLNVYSGGSQQAIIGKPTTVTSAFKSIFAYKLNSFAFTSAGQTVATDTSGSVSASPSVLAIGSAPWAPGATLWNGHIKQLYAYPQRLLNAELEAFSK